MNENITKNKNKSKSKSKSKSKNNHKYENKNKNRSNNKNKNENKNKNKYENRNWVIISAFIFLPSVQLFFNLFEFFIPQSISMAEHFSYCAGNTSVTTSSKKEAEKEEINNDFWKLLSVKIEILLKRERWIIRFLKVGRREWRVGGAITTFWVAFLGNGRTVPSDNGSNGQPTCSKYVVYCQLVYVQQLIFMND